MENEMNGISWIGTIVRFARHRANALWQATTYKAQNEPDYDIPAFIRRGIQIPALDEFHGVAAHTRHVIAPCAGSAGARAHRAELAPPCQSRRLRAAAR